MPVPGQTVPLYAAGHWRPGRQDANARAIVGGVDTHKDLHVATVVDEHDRVLETRSFATTRQGYRQMLAWMRSFGDLQRIGIESTGSYGAGLLRFMQHASATVLEVTARDRQDRRKRGKNDDIDAQNAAYAAFAGKPTVTPRSRAASMRTTGSFCTSKSSVLPRTCITTK